ncbi:MAG: VWA domain-containing protein [Planctomycetota bacterium]
MTLVLAQSEGVGWATARLAEPAWLALLLLAPVVVLLAVWGAARSRALGRRFASGTLGRRLGVRGLSFGWVLRAAMLALALSLGAVGLSRPQWNPEPVEVERRGRDIVFLVDVSRSMLARDLAPSRLGRAKLWIKDLVASRPGDRVALVAFAGAAQVACPLTVDKAFFDLALDELGPASVPRGGTLIGDALRKTVDIVYGAASLEEGEELPAGARDIILISDGEDQESFPVAAAGRAGELGIRIIALGIGSEGEGALVPDGAGGSVEYRGAQVRSRLESGTLRDVSAATAGGVFLPVGTGEIDLAAEYNRLAVGDGASLGTGTRMRYQEGHHWFAAGALVLLLIEPLVRIPRRRAIRAEDLR